MKPSRSRVLEGENERGYHKFVDRLPDGIYRSTVQGRFLAVNSALVKMLGYVSKEQLLTINIPRDLYFSPEDRIKAKRKLKDNKTGTLIVRLKKKDGSELWVEEHGQQILDTRGRVIYYEGILRDITKRRQIENALRESEAKYRLLFEESKQAIFISQVDGRLDDINPTAIALFGYASKDEISQVNIASDLYVNPQDRVALIKSLEENGFVKDHQIVLKRKDGQRLNVLESATAVRNEDGKVIGYRWIIHDLTERKQLEEQLMHAQKMETIGTLVGGISHEFNNLLVVIVGHVEFGLQDTKPNEPIHRDLRRIENAASQARDLINQLLSFSRQQVLKPEQLDFNNCVEEFIKIWERIIGENILLQTKLAAKHAHIWADPLQVQQVLMNLSINARDAMPQGGKLIFETRNVEANKIKTLPLLKNGSRDYLQIKIIDTGLGIDEETQVRIFEPFYTTKEVGKGTGLGLSVVYGIVKHHKGHIEVSSKKGKGTTFTIYFPVIIESKAKQSREKNHPITLAVMRQFLVVEDEEAVRNVTTRLLKRLGYSVLTANNGEEALKMFETQHKNIDLVILDVILPNSDGSGIYPRMRSINPNLSILFVTGYDVKAELDKLRDLDLELEPIRIFQKPLTQEGLGTRVREILHA